MMDPLKFLQTSFKYYEVERLPFEPMLKLSSDGAQASRAHDSMFLVTITYVDEEVYEVPRVNFTYGGNEQSPVRCLV